VRDFNRIDVEGHAPDALENAYSSLEAKFALALSTMRAERAMPTGEDLNLIFNLMALLAVRNPWFRRSITEFQTQIFERILDLILADEKRWESQKRRMQRDGVEVDESVTYAQLKQFHDERRYDIIVPNERNIGYEASGIDAVLPTLGARRWTLFVAEPEVGHFVTCDHPLTLSWADEEDQRKAAYPPGHGLRGTEVVFPISPELILYGAYQEGKEGRMRATAEQVAQLNRRVASFARQQVYASSDRFLFFGASGPEVVRGLKRATDELDD
jgi:hypothetical protein